MFFRLRIFLRFEPAYYAYLSFRGSVLLIGAFCWSFKDIFFGRRGLARCKSGAVFLLFLVDLFVGVGRSGVGVSFFVPGCAWILNIH